MPALVATVGSARTRASSYPQHACKFLTAGSVATSGTHFAAQPFREQPEICLPTAASDHRRRFSTSSARTRRIRERSRRRGRSRRFARFGACQAFERRLSRRTRLSCCADCASGAGNREPVDEPLEFGAPSALCDRSVVVDSAGVRPELEWRRF